MKVKKVAGKRVPPPPPEITKWIQEQEGKDGEQISSVLEPIIASSSLSLGLSSFPFPKSDLFHWVPFLDSLDASLSLLVDHYWEQRMQKQEFTQKDKRFILSILGFFRLLLEQCSSRNIFCSYDSLKRLLVSSDWDVLESTLTLLLIPARKLDSQTSLRVTFETQIGTDELAILSRLSLPFIPNMKELPEARFASLFREHHSRRLSSLKIPPGDEGILVKQQQQYITLISTAMFLMAQPEGSLEDAYFTLSPTLIQDAVMIIEAGCEGGFDDFGFDTGSNNVCGGSSNNTASSSSSSFSNNTTQYIQSNSNATMKPMSPLRLAQMDPAQRERILERRTWLEIAAFSILRCCLRSETKWTEIETNLNLCSSHGPITSILRRIMDSILEGKTIPFKASFIYSYMDFLTTLTSQLEVDESFISSGGIVMELSKLLKGSGVDGLMREEYMRFSEKAFYVLDLLLHEYPIALDVFFSGDGLTLLIDQILLQCGGGGGDSNSCTIHSKVIYQCLLRLLDKLLITNGSDDRFRNLVEGSLFSGAILPSMKMYLVAGSPSISVEILQHLLSITAIFIHNEPTSLSILQELGLIDVMLSCLLKKGPVDAASSRDGGGIPLNVELLTKLPMIFSAICLNEEGVASLKKLNPLPSVIGVYLREDWLNLLRSSYGGAGAGVGEQRNMASSILGTAIEEFIRHQPQFKAVVLSSINDVILGIPDTFADADMPSKTLSICLESISTFLEPLLQNPTIAKDFIASDGGGLHCIIALIGKADFAWDFSLHTCAATFSHMLRVLLETDCVAVLSVFYKELDAAATAAKDAVKESPLKYLNLLSILKDLSLNNQSLLQKEECLFGDGGSASGSGGGGESFIASLHSMLLWSSSFKVSLSCEEKSIITEDASKSLKGDLLKSFTEYLSSGTLEENLKDTKQSFEDIFIIFRTRFVILEMFAIVSQLTLERSTIANLFTPHVPPTSDSIELDCLLFQTILSPLIPQRQSASLLEEKYQLSAVMAFFSSNISLNKTAIIAMYTSLLPLRIVAVEEHIITSIIPLLPEGSLMLLQFLEVYSSLSCRPNCREDFTILQDYLEISSNFLLNAAEVEVESVEDRLSSILRCLLSKDRTLLGSSQTLKEVPSVPSWLLKEQLEENALIGEDLFVRYQLISYYKGLLQFSDKYFDSLLQKKDKSSANLLLISEIIFDHRTPTIKEETLIALLEYAIERLDNISEDDGGISGGISGGNNGGDNGGDNGITDGPDYHLTTLYLLISIFKRGTFSLKENLMETLIAGLIKGSTIPLKTRQKSYRTIFTATLCLIRLLVEGPILKEIIVEDLPADPFTSGSLMRSDLRNIVLRNLDLFVSSYNELGAGRNITLETNNEDGTNNNLEKNNEDQKEQKENSNEDDNQYKIKNQNNKITPLVLKELVKLLTQTYNHFPSSEGPEENVQGEGEDLLVKDHFSRCFILISILELLQGYSSCRYFFLSMSSSSLKGFLSFLLDRMTPSGELGGSLGSKLWVNESMWVSQILEEITLPIKDDFNNNTTTTTTGNTFPILLRDRVLLVVEALQQGIRRFINSLGDGGKISSYRRMSNCWSLTMTVFVLLTSRDPRSIKSNPIQFWIASKMMEKGVFASLSNMLSLLDSEAPMASIVAGKIIHSLELLSRLASRLDKMLSGAISPNSMVREGIVEDLVAEYSGDSSIDDSDSGLSDNDGLGGSDSDSNSDSDSDSDSQSDIGGMAVDTNDAHPNGLGSEDDMEDFLESLNVDGFEIDDDEDINEVDGLDDDEMFFDNGSYGGGIDEFGSDFEDVTADGDTDDGSSSSLSTDRQVLTTRTLAYSAVAKAIPEQIPEVHPLILGSSFTQQQQQQLDDSEQPPIWKTNKDPYHSPYLPSTISRWTALQNLFKSVTPLDESAFLQRLNQAAPERIKDQKEDDNDVHEKENIATSADEDILSSSTSTSNSALDSLLSEDFSDISDDDSIMDVAAAEDDEAKPFIDNGPDKEFILALPFGMREEVLKQYFAERRESIPNPLTEVIISADFLRSLPQDFVEEYERLSQQEIDHYRRHMADSGWMAEGLSDGDGDGDSDSDGDMDIVMDVSTTQRLQQNAIDNNQQNIADINNIVLQIQDQLQQQMQQVGSGGASSADITVTATLQQDASGHPRVIVTAPSGAAGSSGTGVFTTNNHSSNNSSQRLKPSQKEVKELLLQIPKANYSTMIHMKSLSHILLSYYDPVMVEKRTYMRLFEHLVENQRIRPLFLRLLLHLLRRGPADLLGVKECLLGYVEEQTRQGKKRPLAFVNDFCGEFGGLDGGHRVKTTTKTTTTNSSNNSYVVTQQRTLSILQQLCLKNKDVAMFFKSATTTATTTTDESPPPIMDLFKLFSQPCFYQTPLLVEGLLSLLKVLDTKVGTLTLASIESLITVIVRGDIGRTSLESAVKILTRLCEDPVCQCMIVGELTKEIGDLITWTIGEIKVLKQSLLPCGGFDGVVGFVVDNSGTTANATSNTANTTTASTNSILKNISLSSSSQNRLERTIRILCKLVLQPKVAGDGGDGGVETPLPTIPTATATNTPTTSNLDSRCGTPMSLGNPITSVSPTPTDFLKVEDYKPANDNWILLLEELDSILSLLSTTTTNGGGGIGGENIAFGILPSIEAYFWHLRECLGVCDASFTTATTTATTTTATLTLQPDVFAFAERHRAILNSMISHAPSLLTEGPFLLLTRAPHLLDFANKRIWFKQQLHHRNRPGTKRTKLVIPVRREHIFQDSFHALMSKSGNEVRDGKLEIRFRGEEGMDVGGVSREWFNLLSRKMFDPNNALFMVSSIDKITYHPSKMSYCNPDHLLYFSFIGRIIGKAIYDGKILDCHFARSFYKHIFQQPVDYKDMEALDQEYYKSLVWILENDITDVLDLTFSVETDEFGVEKVVDLLENGRSIPVTESNKREYVKLIAEYKLTTEIRHQIDSFLRGFYEIIPCRLIAIFNEQELELLISGLPEIDVEDWRSNTEYTGYTIAHPVIQWFWRAVRSLDGEGKAKLLQFVTGTSKVPLDGFAGLQGSTGVQKFQIHRDFGLSTRLPSAHTCFNQLDLPEYESYEVLKSSLLKAIQECSTGFSLV